MLGRIKKTIAIAVSGFLVLACTTDRTENSLRIACAANMQFAMDSIVVLFEQETGIDCELTIGASGMLTAQIENGAPYAVFLSADMAFPQQLYANGKGEKPEVYAKGRLVLAVAGTVSDSSLIQVLNRRDMNQIGLADPRTAPYGKAAKEYLENTGQWEKLSPRLVMAENVGQVNHYLKTGAVDMAFTAYAFKVKNPAAYTYYEVDQHWFNPIHQGVMVLNEGKLHYNHQSEQLLAFLSSPKCKSVLEYFGYLSE